MGIEKIRRKASFAGAVGGAEFILAATVPGTLAAATEKVGFQLPFACKVVEVSAFVKGSGTGAGATEIDINEGGTSILSAVMSIASAAAGDARYVVGTLADAALADNAKITVDIDAVPATTASTDLTVLLTLERVV